MVKRARREHFDHHKGRIRQEVKGRSSKGSKNNNSTFKLMFIYSVVISLIGMLVILYINQYVELSRMNFQLEKLEEQRDNLKSDKAHLQLKISRLKSLDRIEVIAKTELGMKEAEKINYFVLEEDDESQNKAEDKAKNSLVKDNKVRQNNLKDKILALFNNLTEVQAGTLD